ncbi:MAG: phosphate ABC transporter permease subunit PstC [Actinobacteria bacterium]|nr:phosphate ABC transporter permease subunit PstC [Actinomycetota bacterium]
MEAASLSAPEGLPRTRRTADRIGDKFLYGLTAIAALVGFLVLVAIVWRVADGAWPAIKVFKLGFLWHNTWNPVTSRFGARDLIIGTLVTSFGAVLLAAPLSIAIGLFLSELAPMSIRGPIGTLIEMLAAVPSVVVGLWGIYVLAPFDAQHLQPLLGHLLGWIPIFAHGGDKVESTVFSAMLVLTIMIIPITSSICRELFIGVPAELEEGAVGLGATRWEMVRTVVIPTVRGGVVAAVILGLGRALGEAIAVTQVIGNFTPLKLSIFEPGDTLASRTANQYQGAVSNIQVASLIYLALILLVITFLANFTAQRVVKRFEFQRIGGD